MDTNENNPVEGFDLSVEEQLFAMLEDTKGATPTGGELENKDDEAEDDDLDQEETEDSEDEELDDQDDGEEEESDEDEQQEPDEYLEFEYEGQPVKVTPEEYALGYQRMADYTKKTQAVAEERKVIQAKEAELTQARSEYVQALEVFKEQKTTELEKFKDVNWSDLKENDPEQYLLLKSEQRELQEQAQMAEEDQLRAAQEQHEANLKAFTEFKEKSDEILSQPGGIEGWTDPKEGPKIKAAMREFALSQGYTDEDLSMLIDPRSLKILHMAMSNQKSQTLTKRVAAKKQVKVPKVTRPNARKPDGSNNRRAKLADRLRKQQSSTAAEDLFFDLLEGGG